jgi:hypothetical protein
MKCDVIASGIVNAAKQVRARPRGGMYLCGTVPALPPSRGGWGPAGRA